MEQDDEENCGQNYAIKKWSLARVKYVDDNGDHFWKKFWWPDK